MPPGYSQLLELLLKVPKVLTDHRQPSDDWLAEDILFESFEQPAFLALPLLQGDTRFFLLLQTFGIVAEGRSFFCSIRAVPRFFKDAFDKRLVLVFRTFGVIAVTL